VSQAEVRYCYRHPDRETGLSCSECGRPICAECMTVAPVGIRCPDHSGAVRGAARVGKRASRVGARTPAFVTRILIGINVAVYAAELASGSGIYGDSGWIFQKGALVASGIEVGNTLQPVSGGGLIPDALLVGVSQGEWWRMVTAAFLHYGPIHLGLNMLALWWFGGPLEEALGRARFLCLYFVSGIAGSAGAILYSPGSVTVGASGAIFGILGAAFILERRGAMIFGGQALGLIVLNLAITIAFKSYISLGGHAGGLVGGAAVMFALLHFRRSMLLSVASSVGIAVAAFMLAYWKARGYA
jgi:membrane associated rhomboid family serine protease